MTQAVYTHTGLESLGYTCTGSTVILIPHKRELRLRTFQQLIEHHLAGRRPRVS